MLTLGIETSCDETGASIIRDGKKILSSVISSSLEFHARYGGVVPEIATRHHLEVIAYVVKDAIRKAKVKLKDIDLIAVTRGPGLVGALLVGISFAKGLSFSLGIPIIGVNHLWAHIYSGLIGKPEIKFPFAGLVVSGGHTNLVFCEREGKFKSLGQTKDDAVGEAFDKIAKILGLGYPGGPAIEKAACEGNADFLRLAPVFMEDGSYDFSLSGIKTAVLYYVKGKKLNKKLRSDIAASFQKTVVNCVVENAIKVCKAKSITSLVVGGGVSANKYLRRRLSEEGDKNGLDVIFPSFSLSADNGAMVAAMGCRLYKKGLRSGIDFSAEPNLGI